ncbi:MAG: uracil phosphoribosyltransferase [Armatimonadaceae bacterium]
MPLHLLPHPLGQHLVTRLRDKDTRPADFRSLTYQLTTLLVLEATQHLPLTAHAIQTPLEPMQGSALAQGLAVVPILRAGLGMLDPITSLFPDVCVGYIGLERNHETAVASVYYQKLPAAGEMAERLTLVVDPMLATGGSAIQAITRIREAGAQDIRLVCVVTAPEGVQAVEESHPAVPIYAAALDRELNDRKYILPGLGDFGDRLFGTV